MRRKRFQQPFLSAPDRRTGLQGRLSARASLNRAWQPYSASMRLASCARWLGSSRRGAPLLVARVPERDDVPHGLAGADPAPERRILAKQAGIVHAHPSGLRIVHCSIPLWPSLKRSGDVKRLCWRPRQQD
jgi:hypothetical protein